MMVTLFRRLWPWIANTRLRGEVRFTEEVPSSWVAVPWLFAVLVEVLSSYSIMAEWDERMLLRNGDIGETLVPVLIELGSGTSGVKMVLATSTAVSG